MSNKHREAIEKELWQRDYLLLAEHHSDLLDKIETAVADNVTANLIKVWAMGIVEEPLIVQRIYNAAKYCEANK